MDMSSSTEPYVDGVCSVSIESMVSECGTAAKALENAIHTDISQVATLALKSLNAAFDAIDHACTLLRDVKMDTREAMKVQAHQLNSHFATAKQDWVEIEEITARASQNTKNFQHTTLDQTIKSIGSVEMELSGQMNKTRLAKMQIERRLASLRQQLNACRERATHAKSQSQDAHNRTIIFSIVSNVKWDTAVTENRNWLFLAIGNRLLSPNFHSLGDVSISLQHSVDHSADALISGASNDREDWEASEAKFTDQIRRIEDMLEISRITFVNQENAFEEAEKIEKRCKELRNRTKGFQSDLVRLEYRISDLKKNLTDYSQRLSDVDTNSVTPLRYLLTLEEGRAMLEDAKRVRADMVGLDSRCGFLDM
jgi:chromosome segregation ATPase